VTQAFTVLLYVQYWVEGFWVGTGGAHADPDDAVILMLLSENG
jgi:hypothetical protein